MKGPPSATGSSNSKQLGVKTERAVMYTKVEQVKEETAAAAVAVKTEDQVLDDDFEGEIPEELMETS